MKSVVFLCPNLTGHLNPTIQLAKEFQFKGYTVYYAGLNDLISFTKTNQFEYYELNALPFAVGFDSNIHHEKKEKWLEIMFDRISNKSFNQRKVQIEKLINYLKPEWIFLDEFNYTDFLFCYPFLKDKRIIQLQTKFPDYQNDLTPPLCIYKFPDKNVPFLWKKFMFKKKLKIFFDSIRFIGKSDLILLKKAFKVLHLDPMFQINLEKTFKPTFKNVEEWFLVPKELDFDGQKLKPWQHYIGPMVNLKRPEILEAKYLAFIQKRKQIKGSKLIYCSLGTVLKTHLLNKVKQGKTFFQNLIKIASENPELYFIISLEKELQQQFFGYLNIELENVLMINYAPQLNVLKESDLFITHAGLGSILEAIYTSTPMLLFPLNDLWDQNGNAARIVYKKMGRKGNLNFSFYQLKVELDTILNDYSYYTTTNSFCKLLNNIYKENIIVVH